MRKFLRICICLLSSVQRLPRCREVTSQKKRQVQKSEIVRKCNGVGVDDPVDLDASSVAEELELASPGEHPKVPIFTKRVM